MTRKTNSLRRCRSTWGAIDKIYDLPKAFLIKDVTYLSDKNSGKWGLYKNGLPISELPAANQSDFIPIDISTSVEESREDVYLYIGLLVLHYGHFIIDTLSRLWPLLILQGFRPKLLCHRLEQFPETVEHQFIYGMLSSLDLDPDDLVHFDHSTQISNVIVAEKSFQEQKSVHAVFGELCQSIGKKYWSACEVDTSSTPAYLSKTKLKSGTSRLLNEIDLEIEMDRLGVDIIYPEELSFADQVRLFSRRTNLIGPMTSAFHNAVFSAPHRRIIGLNWSYQINSNFSLFDIVSSNKSYYYWVIKTRYSNAENFGVAWTIPEPRRVANELLDSVYLFDSLEERDMREEAKVARIESSFNAQLRRWRRKITTNISRIIGN